jgi:hypothetical protein
MKLIGLAVVRQPVAGYLRDSLLPLPHKTACHAVQAGLLHDVGQLLDQVGVSRMFLVMERLSPRGL